MHTGDRVDVAVAMAPPLRRVPAVVGLSFERAAQVLDDSGFVARARLVPTAGTIAGVVLTQDVPSGVARPLRSTIGLGVSDTAASTPARSVLMPDVIGLPRDRAIDRLGALSPRIEIVDTVTGIERDSDRVLGSAPAPGDTVFPPVDIVLRVARFQPAPPQVPPAIDTPATEIPGSTSSGDGSETPVPWLPLLAVGAVVAAMVLTVVRRRGRTGTQPPLRQPSPPSPILVALRPAPGDLPVLSLPPDHPLVAAEVTLVGHAPDITLDHPGPLVAREEPAHG